MPVNYIVYHCGLMRCCTKTLDEEMAKVDTLPPEGTIIRCRLHICGHGMVLRDGAWRWNKPEGAIRW